MSTSILNDVKHALGIMPENTAFDSDIIMFINGVFGTLTQLGVGPPQPALGPQIGYEITGAGNVWSEFFTDPRLNAVKSYIFVCATLVFNPPDSGFVTESMHRQKQEMEFRLNVVADYG